MRANVVVSHTSGKIINNFKCQPDMLLYVRHGVDKLISFKTHIDNIVMLLKIN
jgi:hypothetical protein